MGRTRNSGPAAATAAAGPSYSHGWGGERALRLRLERRRGGGGGGGRMELTEVDLGNEGSGAARSSAAPAPGRGRVGSFGDSLAEEEDEEEGAEAPGEAARRASRASLLVSGLLVELYREGRPRARDSVDSSTEASAGSDAFPGGRGSAEPRFLQELRRRPSQRHQRTYLAQKDINELMTIIQELNYRICVQSSKLLRLLKQKDRLSHKVQKHCDIVTACLQAVSQKRPWQCAILSCWRTSAHM